MLSNQVRVRKVRKTILLKAIQRQVEGQGKASQESPPLQCLELLEQLRWLKAYSRHKVKL